MPSSGSGSPQVDARAEFLENSYAHNGTSITRTDSPVMDYGPQIIDPGMPDATDEVDYIFDDDNPDRQRVHNGNLEEITPADRAQEAFFRKQSETVRAKDVAEAQAQAREQRLARDAQAISDQNQRELHRTPFAPLPSSGSALPTTEAITNDYQGMFSLTMTEQERSRPDAVAAWKNGTLSSIVESGAQSRNPVTRGLHALTYGVVDTLAPGSAGELVLAGGGAVAGVLGKVGRILDSSSGGLRTSATVSGERAEAFLVKNGIDPANAKSYVESFEGSITARLVRPGEDFLRYTDRPNSSGYFLTKTHFPDATTAVDALHLKDWGNKATFKQVVTSNWRTIVLEGNVANGAAKQTLVPSKNNFNYGLGQTYP